MSRRAGRSRHRARAYAVTALSLGMALAALPSPASATTAAPLSCTATITYPAVWSGGFDFQITVTNTGTQAFNAWVVTFEAPTGDVIYTTWNGSVTQSGQYVVARNYSSGWLAPGASVNSIGGVAEGSVSGSFTNITCMPASVPAAVIGFNAGAFESSR